MSLLLPKRRHWIDARGPVRREDAGGERQHHQHGDGARHRDRIDGLDLEQLRAREADHGERARQTEGEAEQYGACAVAHYGPADAGGPCAQHHAQPKLGRPLRNGARGLRNEHDALIVDNTL